MRRLEQPLGIRNGIGMPKIIDHDERRKEIVEVAKRLILEGGFEAATMRSIAAEAGFANGALKHYFPGKESIVAATFESVLAEMDTEGWLDRTEQPVETEAVEKLRERLNLSMPLTEYSISAGRVLLVLWDHAASNPELADTYRRFFRRWQDSTIALLRSSRGDDTSEIDYRALALEIMSITIGANVVNLMHPDGEHIQTYRSIIESYINRATGQD